MNYDHLVRIFGTRYESTVRLPRSEEALFYRNAWRALRDFGVGLLELHAVHIQDDLSILALGFEEWRTGSNLGLTTLGRAPGIDLDMINHCRS